VLSIALLGQAFRGSRESNPMGRALGWIERASRCLLKHGADLAGCDIWKTFGASPQGFAILKVLKKSCDKMSFDGKALPRLSQCT
jgi:hypothetical protein